MEYPKITYHVMSLSTGLERVFSTQQQAIAYKESSPPHMIWPSLHKITRISPYEVYTEFLDFPERKEEQ